MRVVRSAVGSGKMVAAVPENLLRAASWVGSTSPHKNFDDD
jgi:hypothetical protein